MLSFSRLNPVRAVRDLRLFLSQRQPYELWFLVLSVVLTMLVLAGFMHDSWSPKEYKRDIIYVEQWRSDRTDAEIRAQQAIDAPIKAKRIAEQKRREEKLRAGFKQVDDKLNSWGI